MSRNRLKSEKSPYLLQHADNPVDWHPWGDEAFVLAEREDKPVFLSIGYSTCHWCHVMARESFEDDEAARLLNDAFICIKVDREERPDIDAVYMTACQLMTGSGGWPLTIIMTPQKEPFYAATYIPKTSKYGRPGLMDLVPRIRALWTEQRGEILKTVDQMTAALQRIGESAPAGNISDAVIEQTVRHLDTQFDTEHGGFGNAPKFPTSHNLIFLLRAAHTRNDTNAIAKVEATLDAMRRGGLFDHIGLGFHRYSTDAEWLVPHFEKMLYDQAMLAMAYLEASQVTGETRYGEIAREVMTYVLRDLASPEGGFYAAEDADSVGVEGAFYLWTADEIRDILDPDDGDLASRVFDIRRDGNYHDEAAQQSTGKNILHLAKPLETLSNELGIDPPALKVRLDPIRQILFNARQKRPRPHRDEKILTDWNGLMIAALALGGRILDEPNWSEAAEKAAHFLLTHLREKESGRLLHRWAGGEAAVLAHLDDYAFLIWGFLELYKTTFRPIWLEHALSLQADQIRHFRDEETGSFFLSADDAEALLVRQRVFGDGAIPSGNSVSLMNLIRLARFTGDPTYENSAQKLARVIAGQCEAAPGCCTFGAAAVLSLMQRSTEVVVVGEPDDVGTQAMIRTIRADYNPDRTMILKPAREKASQITQIAPFTQDMTCLDGKPTAYVCRGGQCCLPTHDVRVLSRLLDDLKK